MGLDAGMYRCCLLFPAARSSKELWEGHGWMLDPSRSRLFAPGACMGRAGVALHWVNPLTGLSGHARLS